MFRKSIGQRLLTRDQFMYRAELAHRKRLVDVSRGVWHPSTVGAQRVDGERDDRKMKVGELRHCVDGHGADPIGCRDAAHQHDLVLGDAGSPPSIGVRPFIEGVQLAGCEPFDVRLRSERSTAVAKVSLGWRKLSEAASPPLPRERAGAARGARRGAASPW